ncbi:MAG: FKBP-type peptidyl-prolyl cis-trans isomerase [Treponema sp.]
MQKRNVVLASLMVGVLFFTLACKDKTEAKAAAPSEGTEATNGESVVKEAPLPTKKETGYAFGVIMGAYLKDMKLDVDYTQVLKGMKDSVAGNNVDMEGSQKIVQRAAEHMRKQEAEANAKAEAAFLEKNDKLSNVTTTESGLQYEVVTEGTGPKPSLDDTVKVHYKGTLLDGTEFDSSYKREKPVEFPLKAVIPGWREGLQLMNAGAKYKFYIPSKIAYGEQGVPQVIPPNSLLTFEVELLEIMPAEKEKTAQ